MLVFLLFSELLCIKSKFIISAAEQSVMLLLGNLCREANFSSLMFEESFLASRTYMKISKETLSNKTCKTCLLPEQVMKCSDFASSWQFDKVLLRWLRCDYKILSSWEGNNMRQEEFEDRKCKSGDMPGLRRRGDSLGLRVIRHD